jgi:hypothetical protein
MLIVNQRVQAFTIEDDEPLVQHDQRITSHITELQGESSPILRDAGYFGRPTIRSPLLQDVSVKSNTWTFPHPATKTRVLVQNFGRPPQSP